MDIIIHPSELSGEISAPSSKSYAHRALICAALADGVSRIGINTVSEDITATVRCLEALGAEISINGEAFSVSPIKKPNILPFLDCGESGSTLRFLLPVVCALGTGAVFCGRGKLPERPLDELRDELCRAGVQISAGFPLTVSGKLCKNEFSVSGEISSQFASGILLSLCIEPGKLEVLPPVNSKPYIEMTAGMLRKFGALVGKENNIYNVCGKCSGRELEIEGDWSNSLVWLASGVKVNGLYESSVQGDKKAALLLNSLGSGAVIDASDMPDSVPVLAAKAAVSEGKTVITGASRLKFKESNRLESTEKMLRSLGADITASADGFIINGRPYLDGGCAETFGDHRIAFAASFAAEKCRNDVIIRNAECVNKSYPDFFEKYNLLGGKADVVQYR